MIDRLADSLKFQGEALKLRARRQEQLAANIANADTPGYVAKDIDFSRELLSAVSSAGGSAEPAAKAREGAVANADGNTVDMDVERQAFLDNAMRYEASLRFVNTRIRSMLTAITGQ